jgi:hypothetical protein
MDPTAQDWALFGVLPQGLRMLLDKGKITPEIIGIMLLPLHPVVCLSEPPHIVDRVPECGERQLPVPPCRFPYPLLRSLQAFPVLCPGPGLQGPIPFGQSASLHLLRGSWSPSPLVRRLLRYYRIV